MSFAGEGNSYRGGGGPSAIDNAAASVLAGSEILLAAPNNAKLHAFYPTPAECTSTIAQAVCNSGQIRVTTNSKQIGGSSNFHISSASILDPPVLNVALTLQVQTAAAFVGGNTQYGISPCGDGWLFQLIQSIEVTFSNSNLSNLILRKEALREWSLAQCRGREQREEMLKNAGCGRLLLLPHTAGTLSSTVQVRASLPLSFLAWQGANVDTGFGFDARTVNGIIQLQINWEPSIYKAFTFFRTIPGSTNTDYSAVLTAATILCNTFDDLYLSFRSYQLMDSTFSVANALATDPYLKYVLPGKWLNSYRMEVAGTDRGLSSQPWGSLLPIGVRPSDSAKITLELTSAPAGMLQAIGIHVRPINATTAFGASAGPPVYPFAVPSPYQSTGLNVADDKFKPNFAESLALDAIQLQYSGQNIIQLNSKKEIDAYMKFIYGDDFTYYVESPLPGGTASTGAVSIYGLDYFTATEAANTAETTLGVGKTAVHYNPQTRGYGKRKGQLYILPLMQNGRQVFQDRHMENLPQYSGSTLTLNLTVLDDVPYQTAYEPGTGYIGIDTDVDCRIRTFAQKEITNPLRGIKGGGPLNPNIDTPIPPLRQMVNQQITAPGDGSGNPAAASQVQMDILYYDRYEVTITYYVAALLVNSNGMVELQI